MSCRAMGEASDTPEGLVALLAVTPTLTSGLASPGGEEASEAGLREERGTQQSQYTDLSAEEAEAGGTQELEEELHALA